MVLTQSIKRILKCSLSRKKRERSNFIKIHDWTKLMHIAPTLFKDAAKVVVDKKCGNIYIYFNNAHLSFHYLYKTKTGCKCWLKRSKYTRKNKSTHGSNIHYKIDDNINLPIYIPIFIKREKFTYDNKVAIPSYHKKWLEWSIDKLNTYITTFSA